MYIVIGILAGIIILQFIIMWKYQRQVKDICRQLAFMIKHDSNMLINHELDVYKRQLTTTLRYGWF